MINLITSFYVIKDTDKISTDRNNKLLKVTKSNYLDNYIKYNESRLKFKPRNNRNFIKTSQFNNDVIDPESVEHVN